MKLVVDIVKVKCCQMEAHRRWGENDIVCRAMICGMRTRCAALL